MAWWPGLAIFLARAVVQPGRRRAARRARSPRLLRLRVHILGASGSGTTTLGRALAAKLGCPHLDTDDVFWLRTDPPFQHIRERSQRQEMLGTELRGTGTGCCPAPCAAG